MLELDPDFLTEKTLVQHVEKAGFEFALLDELYAQADYITIHVPKLKDTIGLVNKEGQWYSCVSTNCLANDLVKVSLTSHPLDITVNNRTIVLQFFFHIVKIIL